MTDTGQNGGFGFFSVEFRKLLYPLKKSLKFSKQRIMMTSFCFNYFWQMIFKNWQLKNYSILLPDFLYAKNSRLNYKKKCNFGKICAVPVCLKGSKINLFLIFFRADPNRLAG
jgi:hypothetical protein